MKFDYIIMNPPYGRQSSTSQKIVNELKTKKVSKNIICLAPPKTFKDQIPFIKTWKGFYGYKDSHFFNANTENLAIVSLNEESVNNFKNYSDLILTKKMNTFRNKVIEYNRCHKVFYKVKSWSTLKKCEIEDTLVFLVPVYTPSEANGVAFAGESYEHNVLKKPIENSERPSGPWIMLFFNQIDYNNFSKWWYFKGKRDRKAKTFLNFAFDTLYRLYGGAPSLNKYVEVLPNLDWTYPWTDEEILEEIGLPKDFLEKDEL